MNRTELNKIVNHYEKNGDFESAKNYIKSYGPLIKGFNVQEELYNFEIRIKKSKESKK